MKNMLVGISLALVLVAAGVGVAAAQRPGPGAIPPILSPIQPETSSERGKAHGLFGTISSKGTLTFTVTTKQGANVVVTVNAETRFHVPTKRNATFADIHVGDRVAVSGTPTTSGLTAKQVSVAPGKPTIQHRVGTVTSYSPGVSITIIDKQGGKETFLLTPQTKISNPKGTGVSVGDRVTVISRRDPSTTTFTATAIVVHPK